MGKILKIFFLLFNLNLLFGELDIKNISLSTKSGVLPLRMYLPKTPGEKPAVLFFHGGGWVYGSIDMYDPICRILAENAGVNVISVEYSLAPQAKFPRQIHEAYDALLWTHQNAPGYFIDKEKIIVAGDSAGGNIAAALSLLARDKGHPPIFYQILIYPVLEYRVNTDSYNHYDRPFELGLASLWNEYLPNLKAGENPLASPLLAKNFSNLPSTLIILAEYDPLYDEGKRYAEKLRSAGVSVDIKEFSAKHGFMADYTRSYGRAAINEIIKTLQSFTGSQQ